MFRGAMVAIVTPFKDGAVDEAALRELIEFQIANGTHGFVPCGTTGESATLSFQEHERVIEITVEQVNKRVPVYAGAGSNNTAEAIRLARHAKQVGADGALLICPYYNKPTQEGLFRHFEQVAKAVVDLPIIVYNIPGRTAVNMEVQTLGRLAKIDNIVGVKESTGSMKQITDTIACCGEDFVVLSGEDDLTFPLLAVGGHGVISVTSNVAPREMADLCNLFFAGDFMAAQKLYYRLLPLCHALFYETNPAPVKAALAMMNRIASEEVRLPLVPMASANRERLRNVMQAFGLL